MARKTTKKTKKKIGKKASKRPRIRNGRPYGPKQGPKPQDRVPDDLGIPDEVLAIDTAETRAIVDKAQKSKFVSVFLTTGNATEAARAVFSGKAPAQKAAYFLNDSNVQALIREKALQVIEKADLSIEEVVREVKKILMADIGDAVDPVTGAVKKLTDWPRDLRLACSGMDVQETYDKEGNLTGYIRKVKFWSKTTAADQLLKVLGGYAADNLQKNESFAEVVAGVFRGKGREE